MGKADFYRKAGLPPLRSRKAPSTEGDTTATRETHGRVESDDTASICPSCAEGVGWDDLEVKQRSKAGWLTWGFSPRFGPDQSDMESYRECPKCGHKEPAALTEHEDAA